MALNDDQEDQMVPGSTADDYSSTEESPRPKNVTTAVSPTPKINTGNLAATPEPLDHPDIQAPQKLTPPVEPEYSDNPEDDQENIRLGNVYDRQLEAYNRNLEKQRAREAFATQRKAINRAASADNQETGRQYELNEQGVATPRIDPVTGQQAVKERKHPVQYDAQGRPYQVVYNEGGEAPKTVTNPDGTTSTTLSKKIKDPDADAEYGANPDDPNDTNLYRKTKLTPWEAIDPNKGIASSDNRLAIASAKHLHQLEIRGISNQHADLGLKIQKLRRDLPASDQDQAQNSQIADAQDDGGSTTPAATIPSGGLSAVARAKQEENQKAFSIPTLPPKAVTNMFGVVNQEATAKAQADWAASEDQRKKSLADTQRLLATDDQIKEARSQMLDLSIKHQELKKEGPAGYLKRKREEYRNSIASLPPDEAQDAIREAGKQVGQANVDILSVNADLTQRINDLTAKRQKGGTAADIAEWDKEAAAIQADGQELQRKIAERDTQAQQLTTGVEAFNKNQQQKVQEQRDEMRKDPVIAPMADQLDQLDQDASERRAKLQSITDPTERQKASDLLEADLQAKRDAIASGIQTAKKEDFDKKQKADSDLTEKARQRAELEKGIRDAEASDLLTAGDTAPLSESPTIAKNKELLSSMDSQPDAGAIKKRQSELEDDDKKLTFKDGSGYAVLHNGSVAINPISMRPDGLRPKGMPSWEDQIKKAQADGKLTQEQADAMTKRMAPQAQGAQEGIIDKTLINDSFKGWVMRNDPDFLKKVSPGITQKDFETPGYIPELNPSNPEDLKELRSKALDFLKSEPSMMEKIGDVGSKFVYELVPSTVGSLATTAGVLVNAGGYADNAVGNWLQDIGLGVNALKEQSMDPRLTDSTAGNIAGHAGGLAGFLIPGAIVGKAAKAAGMSAEVASFLSQAATGAVGAAQNAASVYTEAREMGKSEKEAFLPFLLSGVVGAGVVIPVSHYLNAFAEPVKNAVLKGLVKAASEAVAFTALNDATSIANNTIAKRFYDENRDLFAGIAESSESGAISGAILGLISAAAGGAKLARLKQKYSIPKDWNGKVEDLAQADSQISSLHTQPTAKDLVKRRTELMSQLASAPGDQVKILEAQIGMVNEAIKADPLNVPAESRADLASALVKIAQGVKFQDLSETERATIGKAKTSSGVTFIEDHNGNTIITDTAKEWLSGVAPHAADLIGITGKEAKSAADATFGEASNENPPASQQLGDTSNQAGENQASGGENRQTIETSSKASGDPAPLGDDAPMAQRKQRASTLWSNAKEGDVFTSPDAFGENYTITIKKNRDGTHYGEILTPRGQLVENIQIDKDPESHTKGNGLLFGQEMVRAKAGEGLSTQSETSTSLDNQNSSSVSDNNSDSAKSELAQSENTTATTPRKPLAPSSKRGKMISKILQAQGVDSTVADHYAGLKEEAYPENITNEELRQRITGDFEKDGGVFPKQLQSENESPDYWKSTFPDESPENHQQFADQAAANNAKRQSDALEQNQKILGIRPEGETQEPTQDSNAETSSADSIPDMPDTRDLSAKETKQAIILSRRLRNEAGATPANSMAFARQYVRDGKPPADILKAWNEAGGSEKQDEITAPIHVAEQLKDQNLKNLISQMDAANVKVGKKPLTAIQRRNVARALNKLAPAIARWNDAFEGITFNDGQRRSGGAELTADNKLRISLGDLLDPATENIQVLIDHPERAESILSEEGIHAIGRKILADRSMADGKTRDQILQSFSDDPSRKLNVPEAPDANDHADSAAADIFNSLPKELRDHVDGIYSEKPGVTPSWKLGHEFLRMLAQHDLAIDKDGNAVAGGKIITEQTLGQHIVRTIREHLSKLFSYFSKLSENLKAGGAKNSDIAQVEEVRSQIKAAIKSLQTQVDENLRRSYEEGYGIRTNRNRADSKTGNAGGLVSGGVDGAGRVGAKEASGNPAMQKAESGNLEANAGGGSGVTETKGLGGVPSEVPSGNGEGRAASTAQSPELIAELERLRAEKAEREAAQERAQERRNQAVQKRAENTADKEKIAARVPKDVRPQAEQILSQMHMGDPTHVLGANRERLPASYFSAPLELVQASHTGSDFQINPNYGGENTRPYHNDETEQNKVRQMALPGALDEDSIVSDVKSSADGPPQYALTIFNDKDGKTQVQLQAAGGNGRLQGIKLSTSEDQQRLANLWKLKEANFGLSGMPEGWMGGRFLGVYDLRDPEQAKIYQQLVDKLNPSQGVVQDTASRADIDAALKIPVSRLVELSVTMGPDEARTALIDLIKDSEKLGLDRNLMAGLVKNPTQAQFYMQRLMLASAFHSKPLSEFFTTSRMTNGHATAVGLIKAAAETALRLREAERGDIADALGRTLENIADYVNRGDKIGSAIRKAAEQMEMGANGPVMNLIASALEKKVAYFPLDKKGIKRVDNEETVAGFEGLMTDLSSSVKRFVKQGEGDNLFGEKETAESTIARAIAAHEAKISREAQEGDAGAVSSRRAQDPVKRMRQLIRKRQEEGLNRYETDELTNLEKAQGQHFMGFFDETKAPFSLESQEEAKPVAPTSPANQLSLLSRRAEKSPSKQAAEELRAKLRPWMASENEKNEAIQSPGGKEHRKALQSTIDALTNGTEGSFNRPDIGTVYIPMGSDGTRESDYENGSGINGIITKRMIAGEDPVAAIVGSINAAALGKMNRIYGPKGHERASIDYNGYRAILSLTHHGNEKAWVLTGYEIKEGGAKGVSRNPDRYAPADSYIRRQVVASSIENLRREMGSVNSGDENTLLSRRAATDDQGFYSKLEDVLASKIQGKLATPDQIKALINKPDSGIKAEEIKWSGVSDIIDTLASENGGKVPKQALMDYLQGAGKVQFKEVSTQAGDLTKQFADYGYELMYDPHDETYTYRNKSTGDYDDFEDLPEALQDAVTEQTSSGNQPIPAKYSQYTIPGGENYREVVLTMPGSSDLSLKKGMEARRMDDGTWNIWDRNGWVYREGSGTKEELLGKASQDEMLATPSQPVYRSSHFAETPNYVAHMRLNERNDSSGTPGLFIEEIQSDRHQQGREKGYVGEGEQKYFAKESTDPRFKGLWYIVDKDGKAQSRPLYTREVAEEAAKKESNQGSIPDAPFRKDWPLQMFKRALRDAVASGKGWIGWTSGSTQAERYKLSTKVDALRYAKRSDGTYLIKYIGKGSRDEWKTLGASIPESELADNVGKEVAQKIIDGEGEKDSFSGATDLRGTNLDVGGEGMKGFYDEILPKEIGKYVKKWGAKVEQGSTIADKASKQFPYDIIGPSGMVEKSFSTREAAQKALKFLGDGYSIKSLSTHDVNIWKVEITPELEQAVEGGQSLFSRRATKDDSQLDLFSEAKPEVEKYSKALDSEGITDPHAKQEAAIQDLGLTANQALELFPPEEMPFNLEGQVIRKQEPAVESKPLPEGPIEAPAAAGDSEEPTTNPSQIGTKLVDENQERLDALPEAAVAQLAIEAGQRPLTATKDSILANTQPELLSKALDSIKAPPAKGGITDFGEKIGGARKDMAIKTGSSGSRPVDERPAWERRYQIAKIERSMREGENGRYVIYDLRQESRWGHRQIGNSFATEEEAKKAIPLIAVSRNHNVYETRGEDGKGTGTFSIWRNVTDRKRVQVVKESFSTRDDAMRYMAEHAAQILETKTGWREELIAKPENAVRAGAPRREGPATPEMFQKAFGFRGVEFGNWMRQGNDDKERQEVLNHAYDGLHDLAEVLNVPPQALSLNGELALAFGARGQGLVGAKAHYEADYAVINLTKMKGAGSLAHEWFHALDHYMGRLDGKAKREMTVNPDGTKIFTGVNSADKTFVSHGFGTSSDVREELRKAFNSLMQTIDKKAVEYKEDTQQAEKFVKSTRDQLSERLQQIRNGLTQELTWAKRNNKPATEAQLARFDALADKLLDGDVKTEFRYDKDAKVRPRSFTFPGQRWSNDTLDAISDLYKEIRGRSGFNAQQNGICNDLAGYLKRYDQRINILNQANAGESKTKYTPTGYKMEATKMDQGTASDYWSLPHELAARAFSAYVEDRIAAHGDKSDFLSFGADNTLPGYRMWNVKPFPEGAEREAINKAFDSFFGTIKSEPTEKGVSLQSRRAIPDEDSIKNYLTERGLDRTKVVEASHEITKQLQEISRLQEDGSEYGDLFSWKGEGIPTGGGEVGGTGSGSREGDGGQGKDQGLSGAKNTDILRLPKESGEVFRRGNIVSSLVHSLITREIPAFNIDGKVLKGPADFASLMMPLRSPYFESLKIAFLDKDNRVIHSQILTAGTIDSSFAHRRDMLTALSDARRKNPDVVSALIAHNHPSGNPEPSNADKKLTRIVKEVMASAGITLKDHVITNGQTYYSFDKNERLPLPKEDVAAWENVPRDKLQPITDDQLQSYVSQLRQGADENTAHIIYLTTKHDITAVERVPNGTNWTNLKKALSDGIGRESPYGVLLDLSGISSKDARYTTDSAAHELSNIGVHFLDIATSDVPSFAAAQRMGSTVSPHDYVYEGNQRDLNSSGANGEDQLPLDFDKAREDGGKTPAQRLRESQDLINRTAAQFSDMPNYNADDARQKARIAIANAAKNFDPTKGVPFEAYAGVAAKNALRDLYRIESRYAERYQATLDQPMGTDSQGNIVTPKDQLADKTTRLAPDQAARNESTRLLESAISELPKRMSDVLTGMLRGENGQEIANRMGITRQAVDNIQKAAMRRLQGKLGERGVSASNELLSRRALREDAGDDEIGQIMKGLNQEIDHDVIGGLRDQAISEEGSGKPKQIGRPDLAYGARNPETRAVDQYYSDTAPKETRAQWEDAAQGMIRKDPERTRSDIERKGLSGGSLTPEETVAAGIIADKLRKKMIQEPSEENKKAFNVFQYAYRATGSVAARALASRNDPFMTPAQRHRDFLIDMMTKPSKEAEKAINAEKDPAKKSALIDEETRRVMEKLKAAGITPEDILADRVTMRLADKKIISELRSLLSRAATSAQEIRRTAFDMILKNKSLEAIAKTTGLKVDEIQKIKDDSIAKLRRDHFAKFQAGAKADKTSLVTGKKVSDTAAEGEFQKWLSNLGLVSNEKQGKPKFNIEDPAHVMRVAKAISEARGEAGLLDKAYEAWIAGILSGPQTHVANITGNLGSAALNLTLQRGMESLVNLAIGDSKSASFGEFKWLAKGLMPGIAKGYAMAARAWSSEHDFFEHTVLGTPLELDRYDKTGGSRAAIGGKTGKAVRIPMRALLFSDSMFKTTLGQMEAGAMAYRIAKAEGLSGKALSDRIETLSKTRGEVVAENLSRVAVTKESVRWFAEKLAGRDESLDPDELIEDRGSEAWQMAREQAAYEAAKASGWTEEAWQRAVDSSREMTFQQDLKKGSEGGNMIEDMAAKLQDARNSNKMLGVFFPFVRTPYNIFRIGIRKSPLGAFNLAAQAAKGLYSMKNGKVYLEGHPEAVRDLAEQAIAWGAGALLWGAAQGDEDDDDKQLLITGSHPWNKESAGIRGLNERAFGGEYVIRIGGRNGVTIPFGRMEPYATVLGTTIDMIRAIKRNGTTSENADAFIGYMLAQANGKTFLNGASTISDVMQGKSGRIEAIKKSVLQAIVPNIIRSPLRSLDDYVRDSKHASPLYTMLPASGLAEEQINPYGEPIKKTGSPITRLFFSTPIASDETLRASDKLLLNWNRANPTEAWAPQSPLAIFKDSKGKNVEMTAEETKKFRIAAGRLAIVKLRGVINPRNTANPTQEDLRKVKSAFESATHEAKQRIFTPGYIARRKQESSSGS